MISRVFLAWTFLNFLAYCVFYSLKNNNPDLFLDFFLFDYKTCFYINFLFFFFQTCRSIFVWKRNPFHPKKNSTLTNRSRKSISSQTVPFFLLSKSFSSLFLFHDLTIASIERGNFIYFFWFFVTLYTSQSMFEWSKILCFFTRVDSE